VQAVTPPNLKAFRIKQPGPDARVSHPQQPLDCSNALSRRGGDVITQMRDTGLGKGGFRTAYRGGHLHGDVLLDQALLMFWPTDCRWYLGTIAACTTAPHIVCPTPCALCAACIHEAACVWPDHLHNRNYSLSCGGLQKEDHLVIYTDRTWEAVNLNAAHWFLLKPHPRSPRWIAGALKAGFDEQSVWKRSLDASPPVTLPPAAPNPQPIHVAQVGG
jgi:hypothetical protein